MMTAVPDFPAYSFDGITLTRGNRRLKPYLGRRRQNVYFTLWKDGEQYRFTAPQLHRRCFGTDPRTFYRYERGSKRAIARLTEADIPVIRRLAAEGVPPGRIAAQFNVSRWTVRRILKGETWRHVTEIARSAEV
jgi:hypothetical protein